MASLRASLRVLACMMALVCTLAIFAAGASPGPSPAAARDSAAPRIREFCIIGAGPGGVQMAAMLKGLNRDYVVFERASAPGSFFVRYPRARALISINKVYTGVDDQEFNLRHDWNSLLAPEAVEDVTGAGVSREFLRHYRSQTNRVGKEANDPDPLRFSNFSKKYYPPADALVEYLDAFVKRHALRIVFNTSVLQVRRRRQITTVRDFGGAERAMRPFVLRLRARNGTTFSEQCMAIIMATGQDVPRQLRSRGALAHVKTYQTMSMSPEDYVNKDVLIIGSGNSALEMAQALEDVTASVHIYARRPPTFAFNSHYVGHARAVNLGFVDRYQLKSHDLILAGMPDAREAEFSVDNKTKRIRVNTQVNFFGPPGPNGETMPLTPAMKKLEAQMIEASPLRKGYDVVISCLGFHADSSIFGGDKGTSTGKPKTATCSSKAPTGEGCSGKAADDDDDVTVPVNPQFDGRRKMPVVASNMESVDTPDMYVAGSLMHYRDYKRSAGGFIHGFRYTCRTLAWMLHERYPPLHDSSAENGIVINQKSQTKKAKGSASDNDQPQQEKPPMPWRVMSYPNARLGPGANIQTTVERLVSHLSRRLLSVSSLYQMQGQLTDVLTVERDTTPPPPQKQEESGKDEKGGKRNLVMVTFVPDVPLDMIHSNNVNRTHLGCRFVRNAQTFFTVTLEFGPKFQGLGTLYHQGSDETAARRAEKWGWDDETDPDARLVAHDPRASNFLPPAVSAPGAAGALKHAKPPGTTTPPFPTPSIESLPPLHRLPSAMPNGGSQSAVDDDDDDDDDEDDDRQRRAAAKPDSFSPQALENGQGKFGFQFLHPVIRVWSRRSNATAANAGEAMEPGYPARPIMEHRLQEEPLNEWHLPVLHQKPLREFLAVALRRMLKDI